MHHPPKSPGRPKTVRNPGHEDRVRTTFQHSPLRSVLQHSQALDMSDRRVGPILHYELHFYLFYADFMRNVPTIYDLSL
ncbi:hypothetical protein ANN_15372 [Periplaneta americana]|uniref:Uncharacterized protein n=1 Tax=Periplaneta americana TaxID=6978 RepID=A0ABQ8SH60_PERAM|nr:hypothetical protein ANN_15372 [Periplaneta americana]